MPSRSRSPMKVVSSGPGPPLRHSRVTLIRSGLGQSEEAQSTEEDPPTVSPTVSPPEEPSAVSSLDPSPDPSADPPEVQLADPSAVLPMEDTSTVSPPEEPSAVSSPDPSAVLPAHPPAVHSAVPSAVPSPDPPAVSPEPPSDPSAAPSTVLPANPPLRPPVRLTARPTARSSVNPHTVMSTVLSAIPPAISSAVSSTIPSTPHTPPRQTAAAYGSPSTIRADDDVIVLELGSRLVRAGFAGDSLPKATVSCGPEDQRRVGDFRAWAQPAQPARKDASAEDFELWRYDVREFDLGLFQDKLERLLREAFTKYLLIDSRPRRVGLVLDSALPLPILSSVLDIMFNRFQTPIISLMSSATMATVAAGVRSSLVVDMGWAETVVTSVYEYREVRSTRSVRGGRLLSDGLYKVLLSVVGENEAESQESERIISFEDCEDVMCRLMWCRSSAFKSSQRQSAQLETVEEQDETEAEAPQAADTNGTVQVPITLRGIRKILEIPFDKLADICDETFLDPSTTPTRFDDDELPVHLLVYQHLLHLPMDARAVCMSRIMFTGGCSKILGIKERIMDEVTSIVERRGWASVSGKGVEQLRSNPKLRRKEPTSPSSGDSSSSPPSEQGEVQDGLSPAANTQPDQDPIEAKLQRNRPAPKQIQGELRSIHSLGPWAGASLLCQLKVPAMATVDRELWQQQGPGGASRPSETDVKTQQRQSMGAGGLIRGGGGSHMSWTLGAWGAV